MTEEQKIEKGETHVTVSAVSTRNRSFLVKETGRWAKVKEGVDLSQIEKGKQYTFTYEKGPDGAAIVTGIVLPPPTTPEPPSEHAGRNAESKAPRKNGPSEAENSVADKDLRITRLATIERAIAFLGATQGGKATIDDVLNLAEKMAGYVYHGLAKAPENAARQARQNGSAPGM